MPRYATHPVNFKWVIRSNHIKDCPVTLEDVDVALKIWGKNTAELKVKTTWSKPNTVARDSVKIPIDLRSLHKEVFLTLYIFFVNNIPFLFTLSRKICFTEVNHLANRTVPQTFVAFKEICQYYMHRRFRITAVHSDGEFAPLQALVPSLLGGPMINLASANEHITEIQKKRGGEGKMLRSSTWPSFSVDPQAIDYPHYVTDSKTA